MKRAQQLIGTAALAALLPGLALTSGCNLLLDFDGTVGLSPVGIITNGDHMNSSHVGWAIASDADFLPADGVEIVLSGSDPWGVVAVPVDPVGRMNDDGDLLSDAERINLDPGSYLSFDVPVNIEENNEFGAALAFGDGLLLVAAPALGRDPTRSGTVRAHRGGEANNEVPFTSVSAPEMRPNFGTSVAVGDVSADGTPDAVIGDVGKVWYFPADTPAVGNPIASFGAAEELVSGGSLGSHVAAGAFETNPAGMSIGVHVAASDPDAGTVATFYQDMVSGVMTAGTTASGLNGAAALAFADLGAPLLVVGTPGEGTTGGVALVDPTGGVVSLPVPVEDSVELQELGMTVAVGDLNNDGFDDILAGAPDSTVDGVFMAGAAVVWFGDGAGGVLSGAGDILVLSRVNPEENDRFGASVAMAGDEGGVGLDDDRCGEVLIGAPQTGALWSKGLVLVFFDLIGDPTAVLPGASNANCT